MRFMRNGLTFAAALLLLFAAPLAAQKRAVELGVDGIFAWHNPDNGGSNLFEIAGPLGGMQSLSPLQGVRVGLYVADRFALEPSLGFNLSDIDDETLSRIGVSLTTLAYATPNFDRTRPFLGLGGSFTSFDLGDESMKQFGAHALTGLSVPVAEKLSGRVAIGGARFFENDEMEARWTVFATVGMSFRIGGPAVVAMR